MTEYDYDATAWDAAATGYEGTEFATEFEADVAAPATTPATGEAAPDPTTETGDKDKGGDVPGATATSSGNGCHWHLGLFIVHAVAAAFAMGGAFLAFTFGNFLASTFWAAYEVKDDPYVWPRKNQLSGYVENDPKLSPWLPGALAAIQVFRVGGYITLVTSILTVIGVYPFLVFVAYEEQLPFQTLFKSKFKEDVDSATKPAGAKDAEAGDTKKEEEKAAEAPAEAPPEINKITDFGATDYGATDYDFTDLGDFTQADYTTMNE